MRQTIALFVDAYRYLNARKLFWFTLVLSALIAGSFGALGLNEEGVTVFGATLEIQGLNSNVMSREVFFKLAYVNLGIGIWLAWGATILALVSTASIVPDFISDGSVDLLLSRSIGRIRLFLTKYATGLLFVALQAAAFSLASFLVIGLRADVWEPGLFISIPLVILFFSYLYCVCALLGLVTKSTIASLLLTLGLWFVIFLVNSADTTLLTFKLAQEARVESLEEQLDETRTALQEAQPAETEGADDADLDASAKVDRLEERLDELQAELKERQGTERTLQLWHSGVFAVKTALPKTQETIALNERWMVDFTDLPFETGQGDPAEEEAEAAAERAPVDQDVQRRVAERLRERPAWWVIGTSLGFEGVILAIACWIFKRRNF